MNKAEKTRFPAPTTLTANTTFIYPIIYPSNQFMALLTHRASLAFGYHWATLFLNDIFAIRTTQHHLEKAVKSNFLLPISGSPSDSKSSSCWSHSLLLQCWCAPAFQHWARASTLSKLRSPLWRAMRRQSSKEGTQCHYPAQTLAQKNVSGTSGPISSDISGSSASSELHLSHL